MNLICGILASNIIMFLILKHHIWCMFTINTKVVLIEEILMLLNIGQDFLLKSGGRVFLKGCLKQQYWMHIWYSVVIILNHLIEIKVKWEILELILCINSQKDINHMNINKKKVEKVDFHILQKFNLIHLLKEKKSLNVLNVEVIQNTFVKSALYLKQK